MSFDDALIGSNDFDPQAATDIMLRQTVGGPPLPPTIDPATVQTRLLRKMGEPRQVAPPVDVSPEPTAAAPDFSDQAVEPTATPNADLDFSAQATEPPMIGPQPAPATSSWTDYPVEFGKGVAEGAKNMGASALKGVAAAGIPTAADPALLDELAAAKDMTPAARAKLMGRAIRGISDRPCRWTITPRCGGSARAPTRRPRSRA
jgi:hypothetical protein